ncbi:SRB2 [Candida pseudojiufengensis]|uniref:SRB2 n=1 Tax=Candida pseudojiufengensis TaxID=497109 RepID=UPI002224F30C|nr:SRB2 [Candida pseudojiufengensis]KAI5965719.1 SRB2 [Candida pseudojiufengensis]
MTSVILVQNATPETLIQFQDQLSNDLPTRKGKWSFVFKIFRNNSFAIPKEMVNVVDQNPDSKFMFTLSPSYLPGSTISLIDRKSVGVFTNPIREEIVELGHSAELCIPDNHLRLGATMGLNDSFDVFANSKLQNLWTQKQVIKGDGGQIYELENGNLCIRTSNVFLHGNFRGLLLQIEIDEKSPSYKDKDVKNTIIQITQKYGVSDQNLSCEVLSASTLDKYGDLCLQYSRILDF